MERKSFKFEVKVDEEAGTFEGIASAYRKKVDKVGDIVDPGAFTKTIKESEGKTLITYPPHNIDSIVGDGDIEDTPKGLKITGSIMRELSKGNDAYLLLKRGVIKTLSIGYEVIKQEVINGVRHLKEIKLYEVALVPGGLAADDMAVITSVKTDFENRLSNLEDEIKSGTLVDTTRIKVAIKALTELLQETEKKEVEETEIDIANAEVVDLTGDDDNDSTSDDTEPSQDTQEDKEAAEVEGVIARFTSNLKAEEVGNKIDKIIEKLKEN